MKLADAEKEFWFRIYIWAKAEWEKEINESFPHLHLFKTGHARNICQFMKKLGKEEQLALAEGRLKQGYREEASVLGDNLSELEESLCRKFEAFSRMEGQFRLFQRLRTEGKRAEAKTVFEVVCADAAKILFDTDTSDDGSLLARLDEFFGSIPLSFEEQVATRKLAGEKFRFVTKKKLQKILTQKVKDVFGNQFEECRVDEGHWTAFDIKCDGWMLTTQFNFGRQQSVLGYWHNIYSQMNTPHPAMSEVVYPVAFLCRGVCWPCSSQWEYLITEDDVELACDETFKYCCRFFEAAPRLLKGLEFENITVN